MEWPANVFLNFIKNTKSIEPFRAAAIYNYGYRLKRTPDPNAKPGTAK